MTIMLSKLLADLTLILHLVFILFALFGGLLVLCRRWMLWIHLPVLLWASLVNLAGWTCPLTPIENALRSLAGQAGYSGGFVEHYIMPLVYPAIMSRDIEIISGFLVLVWNGLVYAFVIFRRRRLR
jgi:hypothetical protein